MFKDVIESDFSKIEGKKPEYISVGGYLVELAGGSWDGLNFKLQILEAYGWVHVHERYYEEPTLAKEVYNQIIHFINRFECHYNKPVVRLMYLLRFKSKYSAFISFK